MKSVRFVKTYRSYQSGELAGFEDGHAQTLIDQGFAVDPTAKPVPSLVAPVEDADPVEKPDPVGPADPVGTPDPVEAGAPPQQGRKGRK